jgi:hypothetical protein
MSRARHSQRRIGDGAGRERPLRSRYPISAEGGDSAKADPVDVEGASWPFGSASYWEPRVGGEGLVNDGGGTRIERDLSDPER